MKRREFLTTTATAAGLGLAAASSPVQAQGSVYGKEILELRTYTFDSPERLKAFDAFLAQSAIPALNRAGVRPVGVFQLLKTDNPKADIAEDKPKLYVLLPHKNAESFVSMIGRLIQDQDFVWSGSSVTQAPKEAPAYRRFESSVFLGFDQAPKVEVPAKGPNRLFQLRIYESHNDERALKKIAMFNEGGEIAIFRKCGLPIVFFGQALAGTLLPNLTYMLGFADEAAMKKGWDAFGQDPDWKRLRDDPEYKDTVSNITNLVLRPASSSQI
jgi:hypothetical protein